MTDQTTPPPQLGDLSDIQMESGVNHDLIPFIALRATGTLTDGTEVTLYGQLPPGLVREHALGYIRMAECAVSDAMVARFLMEHLGIEEQASIFIVGQMREAREEAEDAAAAREGAWREGQGGGE